MNASQYIPQDYGHPDRNQDDAQNSQFPQDQPADPHLDPDTSEESSVNERESSTDARESDADSSLPGETD